MSGAYSALAAWFEYLNADCDYEKWSQYLHERLLSLGVACGRGLDIGCGGGYFTRFFQRLGYEMTGFDVSPEMLAKAADAVEVDSSELTIDEVVETVRKLYQERTGASV